MNMIIGIQVTSALEVVAVHRDQEIGACPEGDCTRAPGKSKGQ
jgi:hypothetical protein